MLRIRVDEASPAAEGDDPEATERPAGGTDTIDAPAASTLPADPGPAPLGLEGYPGLDQRIADIGILEWKQEQDALIRLSHEAWLTAHALEADTTGHG